MTSKAIEHWKRTGCILPGHQSDIAEWLAKQNRGDDS